MARIKAKQILEFQDLGTGTTGQYPAWDNTLGKYVLQNQPIDGAKGQDGDHWTSGTTLPSSGINVGDQHLDTSNGNVFQWIGAGGWIGTGNIKGPKGDKGQRGADGPQGPQGAQGPQGVKGQDGDHWTSAHGIPGPGINDGDQHLDSDTGTVYEWDGFNWNPTGNIQGPKGDQGLQGAQGPQGIQGLTGPQGAQGPKGDKGQKGQDGAGFNTVANFGDNRILTSDGTPNGAVAESLFLFDGAQASFQTGQIQFGWWRLTEEIRWESNVYGSAMWFEANGAKYNQAALIMPIDVMVSDGTMYDYGGTPIPMVWDSVNGGVGYQLSSKRFKENIVDLEFDQASLFNEVRGIKYTGLDSDKVQVGFIAEEVEKFDPTLVIHDSEGKPFSLDYSRMVPVLFEVIRDLRSRIEKLEQK